MIERVWLRRVGLTLLALFLGLSGPGCDRDTSPGDDIPAAVAAFDAFVGESLCGGVYDTDCLEVLTHTVCASGCPRVGYSHRGQQAGRFDGHLTLGFLRELRNAAHVAPDSISEYSLDQRLEDLLWSQVQMMLTHPSARFYDAASNPLSAGAVRSGNSVDPTRFHSVTWVNEGGTAHAMVQADLGLWLLTVAMGMPDRGELYLRLSERVFTAFGIPDELGGVRNDRRGNRCFENLYCYWFHSFPVGTHAYPMTVLNQHLHAVRDALEAHVALREWRDYGAMGPDGRVYPLPSEFDSVHIDRLFDWARGGLLQLAFGAGNEAIHDAPPNLEEFLAPEDVVGGVQRYRAYYRYEMGTGPRDGSASNACHYSYHSVKLFADTLERIDHDTALRSDPGLEAAYFKLLYGRELGDTRTCSNRSSIPPSRRVMRGVPLAELYFGSQIGQAFQSVCPANEPDEFRNATGPFVKAAPFFAEAYDRCEF